MITDAIFGLFMGILTPILLLVGFAAPPVGDFGGAAVLGSEIGQANRYLPIDQFVILAVAGLAFDLVMTGAQFIIWLYGKIPFKAT